MADKHLFTFTTERSKYESAFMNLTLSGQAINFVADPQEPFFAVNPLNDRDLVKFKTLPENTVSKNYEDAILVSTGTFAHWTLLKDYLFQPQTVLPKNELIPLAWECVLHIGSAPLTEEILEVAPPATIIVSTQNPENKGGLYYYTEDNRLKKIAFIDDFVSGSGVTEQYLKDHGVLPELSEDSAIPKASGLCFYNTKLTGSLGSKIKNPCIINHLKFKEADQQKISLMCGDAFGTIDLATTKWVEAKYNTTESSLKTLRDKVTENTGNIDTLENNVSTLIDDASETKAYVDLNSTAIKLSYIRGNENIIFRVVTALKNMVLFSDLVKIPGILMYKKFIKTTGKYYSNSASADDTTVVIPKGKVICDRDVAQGTPIVYEVISNITWGEIKNIENKADAKNYYKNNSKISEILISETTITD